MKNFENSRKYSTIAVKNLEEEANKEVVSDLFHLGLTSTVAFLLL